MNKRGFFLVVVFSIYIFCACSSGYGASNEGKDEVLAIVNGETITKQDYYDSIGNAPSGMREKYEDPKQIKRHLDKMIERKLLLQEGLNLGIDKDPVVVKRLNDLRQRLVIDALYKRITANELTDEKVEQYYKENKARYTKETVRASHILVKTESDAQKILKELNGGSGFEALAQKYSLDPSREKGGDLGFIARGQMAPEFDKALFELKKVGDISPIVKTRFGYHIIKLTAGLQKNTESFSKVKNLIRRDLEKGLIEEYINKLKRKAKISVPEQYQ